MAETLDLKGLKCPLPVLRAKKALKALAPGAMLRVLATDPGSVKDFQAFCETTGNELVSWAESDGVFTYSLRKKS
jgi:tRNA 2-thiouridine synthesizing protein A